MLIQQFEIYKPTIKEEVTFNPFLVIKEMKPELLVYIKELNRHYIKELKDDENYMFAFRTIKPIGMYVKANKKVCSVVFTGKQLKEVA